MSNQTWLHTSGWAVISLANLAPPGDHTPTRCPPWVRSINQMDIQPVTTWYLSHRRDLPWREPGTSAWAILVSEVMLQQTPVARVIPVWTDWISRWPTAQSMATAPLGEVLSHWNRMGYPRRARNLHQAATVITKDHGGVVPSDVDTLLTLPGVGDYTARAVACFAYGQPHPVADTNVKRVVARVDHGDAAAGHWSTKQGLALVDQAVSRPVSDADYCLSQQALMELGALVCTAKSPSCDPCPLSDSCAWKAAGYPVDQAVLPRTQARYEGSDRQVRGLVLGLLREAPRSFGYDELEPLWPKRPTQLRRAVVSLVRDGLVIESDSPDGPTYSLSWSEPYPGE